MSEDSAQKEKSEKESRKSSIITNPTLMGWLTIISLPLGLYGLYLTFIFNKEVKPAYRVLSDVVITRSQSASKIRVFYDSTEVQNVRAVKIALWNAGNEFLDKEAIAQDRPITIHSTKPVGILEVKQVATTRTDLQFVLFSVRKRDRSARRKSNDFVNLSIRGDEGLEAGDGAIFQILYTSPVDCNWVVNARIKGIPKGFQRSTGQDKGLNWSYLVIFLFLAGGSYHYLRQWKKLSKADRIYGIFIVLLGFVAWLL